MNEGLIPRRYAKALYEVAVERNQAERLYRLMKCLEQQFEASPALEATLANPFVSESDKIALLRTAAGAIDADTAAWISLPASVGPTPCSTGRPATFTAYTW